MSATNTVEGAKQPTPAPKPRRRRRSRRFMVLSIIAGVVILALVAAIAFVVFTVRRPLPQTSGNATLRGLDADVSVIRDGQGVPQIYADTAQDLFRAQGYVQAQDRFFEMDYRRHVASGRLAELVGDNEDAIASDKAVRTFGWREVAEAEWGQLDADTKSYLQAYADGVNAYLASRSPGQIAVEYTVLGQQVNVSKPEQWDPVDSLVWLKAMAWDLRGNYDEELARAQDYTTLQSVKRVDQLFPAFPSDHHSILTGTTSATAGPGVQPASGLNLDDGQLQAVFASTQKAIDAVPQLIGDEEGTGSNSWVISGKYTTSGKPLLANDPHLGFSMPGVWAQVGLHCNEVEASCPFDVAGFSFAGFPGVIIGHNGQLAWGLTNMEADVTDFFVERLRAETYLRGNEWEDLTVRHETIKVNGADSVPLTVRSTVHGPIVSDVLDDLDDVSKSPTEGSRLGQYAVSLSWTALTPGFTAEAIFALDTAKNADDIQAAAARFDVPAQNIVYATTDGHIGYQAPGRVPIREDVTGEGIEAPSDGTWPRPGWDPRYDWQGYVKPSDMPHVEDPSEGFIVAANQQVEPQGAGPYLSKDWDYGYRSERIRALIEERIKSDKQFDSASMSAIQVDDWSPYAAVLVPYLLDQQIDDSFNADGQKLLANWDYRMDTDSPAAAYFAAVWRNLLKITFDDDLPTVDRPTGSSRWLAVVQRLLETPNDPLWDNRETLSVTESRDEVLNQALVSARRDLTVSLGKSPSDWSWGKLHKLYLRHPVFGGQSQPWPVRDFFNPAPVELPGGSSIVDANAWDASSDSFDVTSGPSMRMVVDLSDLDKSTWVVVTGTSGHPASSHYTDQLGAWKKGDTFAWPFSKAAVEESRKSTLTLQP